MVCFFKTKSQYSKKILVTPFLKNGQVLYSFKNKAYLKPWVLHPVNFVNITHLVLMTLLNYQNS